MSEQHEDHVGDHAAHEMAEAAKEVFGRMTKEIAAEDDNLLLVLAVTWHPDCDSPSAQMMGRMPQEHVGELLVMLAANFAQQTGKGPKIIPGPMPGSN